MSLGLKKDDAPFCLTAIVSLSLFLLDASTQGFAQSALSSTTQNVRPFITDDARVVGNRLAQLESWYRQDKETLQQWFLAAYGPTEWLELTLGGVLGVGLVAGELEEFPFVDESTKGFAFGLPLVQAKILFKGYEANALPGVSLVVGTFLPYGSWRFATARLWYIWVFDCLAIFRRR